MNEENTSDRHFRWRGTSISRIEAFCDAVFAIATALLVVSADMPETFDQLRDVMVRFLGFAFSFALLMLIWYFHYQFFRRFGLQDRLTIVLNAALMFVVLFYVYPLKFLSNALAAVYAGVPMGVTLADGSVVAPMQGSDWPELMIIYSSGYLAIFLIFTLLYLHAYRKRGALGLSLLEGQMTRLHVETNLLQVLFGVASIAIAAFLPINYVPFSGIIYMFVGPAVAVYAIVRSRKWKAAAS